MKKTIGYLMTIAIILAISLVGCKKYENGPSISTASIKSYVINVWKAEKVTASNGQDLTSSYTSYTIEFNKDKTFIERWNTTTIPGSWDLDNDKNNIITSPTDFGSYDVDTYLILKLKSNELWVRRVGGSPSGQEIHFIPN